MEKGKTENKKICIKAKNEKRKITFKIYTNLFKR